MNSGGARERKAVKQATGALRDRASGASHGCSVSAKNAYGARSSAEAICAKARHCSHTLSAGSCSRFCFDVVVAALRLATPKWESACTHPICCEPSNRMDSSSGRQ